MIIVFSCNVYTNINSNSASIYEQKIKKNTQQTETETELNIIWLQQVYQTKAGKQNKMTQHGTEYMVYAGVAVGSRYSTYVVFI